jgi:hypothetical protein
MLSRHQALTEIARAYLRYWHGEQWPSEASDDDIDDAVKRSALMLGHGYGYGSVIHRKVMASLKARRKKSA